MWRTRTKATAAATRCIYISADVGRPSGCSRPPGRLLPSPRNVNPLKCFNVSTSRIMKGGFADRRTLPRGPNGRNLCRWCNLEVPQARRTFCSEWCVNEWRLRTDPGYLRDQVFERDRGICSQCGIDTVAEWKRLR